MLSEFQKLLKIVPVKTRLYLHFHLFQEDME